MLIMVKAGIFRYGGGTSKNYMDVEEGEEANGGGGGGAGREDFTEISSENSALVRSSDHIHVAADQEDDDDDADNDKKKKKRKKYHRHTLDQIREMEA